MTTAAATAARRRSYRRGCSVDGQGGTGKNVMRVDGAGGNCGSGVDRVVVVGVWRVGVDSSGDGGGDGGGV